MMTCKTTVRLGPPKSWGSKPLQEVGAHQGGNRALSGDGPAHLGQASHGLPCLPDSLRQPDRLAKLNRWPRLRAFLRDLGFEQLRLRHHEEVARLEVVPEDMSELSSLA